MPLTLYRRGLALAKITYPDPIRGNLSDIRSHGAAVLEALEAELPDESWIQQRFGFLDDEACHENASTRKEALAPHRKIAVTRLAGVLLVPIKSDVAHAIKSSPLVKRWQIPRSHTPLMEHRP
jgi:hypothetical protein